MNTSEETQAAEMLLDSTEINGVLVDWIIVGRFNNLDGTTTTSVVASDDCNFVMQLGLAQVVAHSAAKRLHASGE